MQLKSAVWFILCVIFTLGSAYCFLWIFSSSSLAIQYCNANYSLFHADFRCRQPYIAMIFWLIFAFLSVLCFIFGWRLTRKK